MQDLIIKGDGNSRYLKSDIGNLTWEQARAMLQAGTFPIDLNGINPDGVDAIGTPLNKATLLPDDVVTLLGIVTQNPLVKDAFVALYNSIGLKADIASPALTGTPTAPTAANGASTTQIATTAFVQDAINNHTPILSKSEVGSYVGTGTYGSEYPNTLTFSFDPQVVIISAVQAHTLGIYHREAIGSVSSIGMFLVFSFASSTSPSTSVDRNAASYNAATHTLRWYSTDSSKEQLNLQNVNGNLFSHYWVAME